MWRRVVCSTLAAACIAGTGCGHNLRPRSYDPPGEQLILPDEIAQSGATDAWDVVRRLTHMSTTSSAAGQPSRMYRRGHGSIVIRETPLVVVDGVQSTDIAILTEVRADQIAWMRVLTGAVGTTRYGAAGGAGAVIVQTLAAPPTATASAPR
jgi:TonB-dependent Receptor Plug Domain